MSPEQRVALSLLRDGKQPPAVIPEPRKAPSAWRIRMDKQEAWRVLRAIKALQADLKLPLYTRMKNRQRQGMTLREIADDLGIEREEVVQQLFTDNTWSSE
jgi:hypothetical protein